MKTIWITGGSGYLASYLVRVLKNHRNNGLKIITISRTPPDYSVDDHYSLDLSEPGVIEVLSTLPPPRIVFHLATALPPSPPDQMWSVNLGGTVHLFKVLKQFTSLNQEITFLNVGSAAEYSGFDTLPIVENSSVGGTGIYGETKWAQSELALRLGSRFSIKVIVARPFNIIGPGLSDKYIAGTICKQILDNSLTEISLGNLDVKRDFVDVRDVARAIYVLAFKGKTGECYNICSAKSTSVRELYKLFVMLSGNDKPVVTEKHRKRGDEIFEIVGSFEKIKRDTGWMPEISLKQSVHDMLHYRPYL